MANPYTDKTNMYKVAFEESVRALKDQVDELSNIRQRIVSYLAFVGSATAFLVGSSLNAPGSRDDLFFFLASVGTAFMGITIGCATVLLRPKFTKIGATASAQTIITGTIERQVSPIESEAHFYRDLAIYNDRAVDKNDGKLKWTQRLYITAITCGALQLTVWIVLVWLRG
ncbi:hypothetical protein A9X00_07095 [Mycobacterium sp. 1245805.9]|nr:hypothetical protein A9X00_07095 [Mycobacterium sp. 1245805.9]